MAQSYNVILIGIDTLRADHLGCYGYGRDTSPTIDGLAKRGTLFKNAFSQAPITSPSFMSIMTSLYPTYHGVTDFMGACGARGRVYTADPSIPTLAEILKKNNYRTGAFTEGGQLYGKLGFEKGFDYYSMNPNQLHRPEGSIQEDEIFYWLKEYRRENFFLFFHTYAVHSPWMAPKSYWELFENGNEAHFSLKDFLNDPETPLMSQIDLYPNFYQKINRWIPADIEYVKALYDGGLRYVDDFIGKMMAQLSELGVLSNTIVVITADHGEEFMDHGRLTHNQLYDELLHVPLIILGPSTPEKVLVDQIVRSIDILPTVLDLLGIPLDSPIHGTSLVRAHKQNLGLSTLAETEHLGYAFRNATHKYIYPFYRLSRNRFDELYDITKDPKERHNIALSNLDIVTDMMHQSIAELHRPGFSFPQRRIMYAAEPSLGKRASAQTR